MMHKNAHVLYNTCSITADRVGWQHVIAALGVLLCPATLVHHIIRSCFHHSSSLSPHCYYVPILACVCPYAVALWSAGWLALATLEGYYLLSKNRNR